MNNIENDKTAIIKIHLRRRSLLIYLFKIKHAWIKLLLTRNDSDGIKLVYDRPLQKSGAGLVSVKKIQFNVHSFKI